LSGLPVDVAEKLAPLVETDSARYRAAYGGRGGAKSHFFAELLILHCYSKRTRAVCIREVQLSLKESVRQLLIDKIAKFGLEADFEVLEAEIRCPHGGLIIFRGMQSYNAESIKSLEAYDIAWVEEAQTLSARSLKMLRPTIRADGSEIWFSWNPRHDTDPVDMFFRGPKKPPSAIVININWDDNPWFPSVLQEEMEHDRDVDPEMAVHIWDGGYEIISEGSYYARLLAYAESEGRVGFYPHDPALPVNTAWDIGVDDYTAIWFMQENVRQVRAIGYCEFSGAGAEQILTDALPELLKDEAKRNLATAKLKRPEYKFGKLYLPHDIKVREWGAGARSRVETLISLGVPASLIHVGAATDPADRIQAARRLIPYMQFNQEINPGEGVNLGLSRIRKYSRRFNETLGVYVGPLHDENSHGADAFGEYAINCPLSRPKPQEKPKRKQLPGQVVLQGPPEPQRGVRIRI
jgi:phage terminase large subunit